MEKKSVVYEHVRPLKYIIIVFYLIINLKLRSKPFVSLFKKGKLNYVIDFFSLLEKAGKNICVVYDVLRPFMLFWS